MPVHGDLLVDHDDPMGLVHQVWRAPREPWWCTECYLLGASQYQLTRRPAPAVAKVTCLGCVTIVQRTQNAPRTP